MKIRLGMWEMQYSIIHLNLGFMPKQIASNAPDDPSLNLAYPQNPFSPDSKPTHRLKKLAKKNRTAGF